jgi:hypothetical protein
LTSETLLDIDLPVADRPAGRAAARSQRGAAEPDRPRTQRGTGAVQNPQRSTPLESASSASSRSASSSASTPNKFANASARSVPLTTIPPAADMHLYKSGDPGVIEPVLVKPYLPVRPRPDIPDSALGVLELVVDARGLVESVHLKSPRSVIARSGGCSRPRTGSSTPRERTACRSGSSNESS